MNLRRFSRNLSVLVRYGFGSLFVVPLAATLGCQQIADGLGGPDRFRAIAIDAKAPATPLSCDTSISNNYGGGDGSVSSPYKICNLSQWKYWGQSSADWNQNFALESDLDFTGVDIADILPIGNPDAAFTGSFNGGDHKLANISITGATQTFALFGQTNVNAKIEHLVIEDMTVSSDQRVAAVVLDHGNDGKLTLSHLTLSRVSLTVTAPGIISGLGALVGAATGDIELTDHTITNLSTVYPGNARNCGGIVGNSTANITAERISIAGLDVTNSSLGNLDYFGGFVGYYTGTSSLFRDVTITDLNMTAGWNAAGLVARAYGSTTLERVRISGTITSGGGQSGLIQELSSLSGTPTLTVTDSSYEGALVNAGNSNYGGLLGTIFGNLTLQRSHHIGNLAVWSGGVGGLVGQVGGAGTTVLIEDSFSQGTTTTTHATQGRASGLVGITAGGTTTIRRSYAARGNAGTATPGKSCVVDNSSGTVTLEDVYFDSTLCTGAIDFNTALVGATGSPTASLQTVVPFTNWLTSVWSFTATGYPTILTP
jgi:hypothetical protein